MSTKLPLRSIPIPALQRQCLFQPRQTLLDRPQYLLRIPPPLATRAFSSTPSRPRKKIQLGHDKVQSRVTVGSSSGPSPRVEIKNQEEDMETIADDIGLLQHTFVRAPLRTFTGPGMWKEIIPHYWRLVKSKVIGRYSRLAYRRLYNKRKWLILPADAWNHGQIRALAKAHYDHVCNSLATGKTTNLEDVCVSSLYKNIEERIKANSHVETKWKRHSNFRFTRLVSHSAMMVDDSTGFRQAIVRLQSVQSVVRKPVPGRSVQSRKPGVPTTPGTRLPWMPDAARQKADEDRMRHTKPEAEGEQEIKTEDEFPDNGVQKTVVEYLVLQRRVVKGIEEDWKIWGFANESTPEELLKQEEHWANALHQQLRAAGS
ncbi:hypothetical protein BDW02DRAFT_573311 [Decorospora gaudefroyi]|uniref:Uncharacterized protein n=1 Tax=Decorospora gaudefroyi TaxID=184978 RepID=A0A6A5K0F3_9PLEO|nr:hypothetical protein BDW02DRAFT_573311 [Decorospora gaudefroyi]